MVVEVKAISKSFPGVRSLDRVDFSVSSGEVRALVGENGAGKSTLIKIIAGAYTPDEGELLFDGANVKWSSPHEAQAAGIHVIYQELVLFPEMTVAQNIFVNRQPRNNLRMIDYRAMNARAKALLGELGAPIDVGEKIKRLSVADRQMVEIARALNSDAKLIVFDEPTAVLGGHEVDLLFAIVRRLKQRGVAIVFISHRLDEVFEIADSVTVLKDGKLVGTVPIDAVDRNKLVAMMIGRNLADIYPPKAQKGEVGEVAVEAKDVVVGDRVKGVSFEARKGEVLGVAGMVGAGRTELAHAVFGSLPLDGGSIRLVGQAVAKPSPARSIAAGLGFLTEDRKGEGLFMLLDLAANVTPPVLDTVGASVRLDRGVEKDIARRQIRDYSIAATGPEASVANLSGGNQQKVLLGRWVTSSRTALILDEPTRGVDVGAKVEIYRIIRQLARQGLAIIVISSELPEIVGLCDRVVVLCEGSKTGELTGLEITENAVLQLAVARRDAMNAGRARERSDARSATDRGGTGDASDTGIPARGDRAHRTSAGYWHDRESPLCEPE
jgi:ribose transport system ATP-binding protein